MAGLAFFVSDTVTINQIAEELFSSKEVDNCIKKVVAPEYFDDFKQELFLIILNDTTGSFMRAYKDGKHRFHTVRTILNLTKYTRGVFHKKYLEPESMTVEFTESVPCQPCEGIEIRRFKEEREDRVLEEIKHMDESEGLKTKSGYPFYLASIEAVRKYGGIRKASRATGIPKSTLARAVIKVREHLKTIQ